MTFAERLYELLREELLAELASRRTASPAARPARIDREAPVTAPATPKKSSRAPATPKKPVARAPKKRATASASNKGAAPAPQGPSTREQAVALSRELVAFVKKHPGCRRRELRSITGCAEHTFVLAVAHARSSGAIRLDGERNAARYFPA